MDHVNGPSPRTPKSAHDVEQDHRINAAADREQDVLVCLQQMMPIDETLHLPNELCLA
jgi:hypothetical protein